MLFGMALYSFTIENVGLVMLSSLPKALHRDLISVVLPAPIWPWNRKIRLLDAKEMMVCAAASSSLRFFIGRSMAPKINKHNQILSLRAIARQSRSKCIVNRHNYEIASSFLLAMTMDTVTSARKLQSV